MTDAAADTDTSNRSMRLVRFTALAEGTTYLLLLATVVLHRVLHSTNLTPVMGPVHGVTFLVYLAAMLYARSRLRWDTTVTAFAIVAAVVPFGGFYVERHYLR